MKTVAIVPINALALAKSRLAAVLSPDERRQLVFWMADRVLRAVRDSGMVDAIAVVSPDVDALMWAGERGAVPILQRGGRLNAGLFQARRWALESGAARLLVLLADLPLLTPDELRAFVALTESAEQETALALAPDRQRVGTNAMLLRPPDVIPFAFGRASFVRHQELAASAGIVPRVLTSPGLAFDTDQPDDVETLRQRGLWAPQDESVRLAMKEGA